MFPKKLLLCVDSIEHFDTCKAEVGWMARHLSCDLVLFHAAPERWLDAGPVSDGELIELPWLNGLVDDPALVNLQIETATDAGFASLVDSIHGAANKFGADVIVVPTHGRHGIDRLLFDSVAERVLRSCKFPVLTFDLNRMPVGKADLPIDRIVCPIDFSKPSKSALAKAAKLAKELNVGLTVFHAINDYFTAAYPIDGIPSLDTYLPHLMDEVAARVDDLAKTVAEEFSLETSATTSIGSITNELADCTDKYGNPLIVMSTAGRDSLGDHILGSLTERVVRSLHVPVLALPQEDAE